MGLDAITKKSEAMGKKTVASFLKVNKYENPQMSLDLIAHICTANEDINIDDCFNSVFELLIEMKNKKEEVEHNFLDNNLPGTIVGEVVDLIDNLLSNTSSFKIAIAGGYSAGKSSLLNALTKIDNALPTGIEPVSIIPTYLNCSKSAKELAIKGVNLRDRLVLLDKEVLACIQHSSKSKVYLSSVLKKLILDVPVEPHLDNITFIDTPGYNNSNNKNAENRQTDYDTAHESFKEADAIFWCIDIEAGTISQKDLEIIKNNNSKPVVIVFTKMDKKPPQDVKKIIDAAQKICSKELDAAHTPLEIIGLSCINGMHNVYSTSNHTLSDIINNTRAVNGKGNHLDSHLNIINDLFQEEIDASDKALIDYENKRIEKIKDKDEWFNLYLDLKQDNIANDKFVNDILIANYDEILASCNKSDDLLQEAQTGWLDALEREMSWHDKVGFFSDASSLWLQHSKASDRFTNLINKTNEYQYYPLEARQEAYTTFSKRGEDILAEIKSLRDSAEEEYKEILGRIQKEESCRKFLIEYQLKVTSSLQCDYEKCACQLKKHLDKLQKINNDEGNDIFSAISGDNMNRFLSCISQGLNLEQCNKEGYSPLTWAVKSGNNEMVKFFIRHGVDLNLKDDRGYNAFETAVIYHYQDMCKLLLDADRSLINCRHTLEDLAKQNNFVNWVAQL